MCFMRLHAFLSMSVLVFVYRVCVWRVHAFLRAFISVSARAFLYVFKKINNEKILSLTHTHMV